MGGWARSVVQPTLTETVGFLMGAGLLVGSACVSREATESHSQAIVGGGVERVQETRPLEPAAHRGEPSPLASVLREIGGGR